MATYNLTLTIPSSSDIKTGDILNCPYSGTYKSITLPKGAYQLECWGAQGGEGTDNSSVVSINTGGKGGYSIGTLTLSSNTTTYIYVGGKGIDSNGTASARSGGWNGGGECVNSSHIDAGGGSGGGASDIRINSTSLYARVIVAGGGGGRGYNESSDSSNGGAGGGLNGISGLGSDSANACATGGTLTSGGTCSGNYGGANGGSGSFGYGGVGGYISASSIGAGGGGGWYGGAGGKSGNNNGCKSGGGGSGYVYTESTASNYPSGCQLNSSYYLTDAQTIAGDTSFPSTSGSTETGHSGNGYARITVIHVGGLPLKIKQNGEWKDISKGYTRVSGLWKEIDKVFRKVSGEWIEN